VAAMTLQVLHCCTFFSLLLESGMVLMAHKHRKQAKKSKQYDFSLRAGIATPSGVTKQ